MVEKNMNDFALCAGIVLIRLYDTFPKPMSLDSHMMKHMKRGFDVMQRAAERESGEQVPDVELALINDQWTIQFLEDEGFIRNVSREKSRLQYELEPKSMSVFSLMKAGQGEYVLTLHGLKMLENISDESAATNIERIRSVMDGDSFEEVKDLMAGMLLRNSSQS